MGDDISTIYMYKCTIYLLYIYIYCIDCIVYNKSTVYLYVLYTYDNIYIYTRYHLERLLYIYIPNMYVYIYIYIYMYTQYT